MLVSLRSESLVSYPYSHHFNAFECLILYFISKYRVSTKINLEKFTIQDYLEKGHPVLLSSIYVSFNKLTSRYLITIKLHCRKFQWISWELPAFLEQGFATEQSGLSWISKFDESILVVDHGDNDSGLVGHNLDVRLFADTNEVSRMMSELELVLWRQKLVRLRVPYFDFSKRKQYLDSWRAEIVLN